MKILSRLKGNGYSQIVYSFPRHAAARALLCKNLKERAIVIQDFELASHLRSAERKFEKYAKSAIANRKSEIRS